MKVTLIPTVVAALATSSAFAQISVLDSFDGSLSDNFFAQAPIGTDSFSIAPGNFLDYDTSGGADGVFLTFNQFPVQQFDFVASLDVANFANLVAGGGFVDIGIQVNVSGQADRGLRVFLDGFSGGAATSLIASETFFGASLVPEPLGFGAATAFSTVSIAYDATAQTLTAFGFNQNVGASGEFVEILSLTLGELGALDDFVLGPTDTFAVSIIGFSSTIDVGGAPFTVTADNFSVEQIVPEPSTYAAIFGVVGLAFALLRRRLRKARA